MQTVKNRLVYIDYLKAISILFVILQHTFAYYVQKGGQYAAFAQNFRVSCAVVNVPVFFICAGFLCHRKELKTFYFDKIERILIPFLVFGSLKLIYSNFISAEYMHGSGIGEQLISTYINGDVYWFCYSILLVFLVAPLLWKKEGEKGISMVGLGIGIVCIVAIVFSKLAKLPLSAVFQFDTAVFHFPLFMFGYFMREYKNQIEEYLQKYKVYVNLGCVGIAILYFGLLWNDKKLILDYPVRLVTCIAIFVLLYECTQKMSDNLIVRLLSTYSLQIMFLDAFYKAILFVIVGKVLPLSICSILLVTVLDMTFCVVTCLIVKKVPYVKKLFGL